MRAGESTPLVPKKFAFKQVIGDRGAICGDERSICPVAQLMDRTSDQLLSRTAFTKNHDTDVRCSDTPDGVADRQHARGRGDDPFERAVNHARQPPVLLLKILKPEGARQDQAQLIDVHWFREEIVGAYRYGAARIGTFLVATRNDHFDLGIFRNNRFKQEKAFASAIGVRGKAEIDNRDAGLLSREVLKAAHAIARGDHSERIRQRPPHLAL